MVNHTRTVRGATAGDEHFSEHIKKANTDIEVLRYFHESARTRMDEHDFGYLRELAFEARVPDKSLEATRDELARAKKLLRAFIPTPRQMQRDIFL